MWWSPLFSKHSAVIEPNRKRIPRCHVSSRNLFLIKSFLRLSCHWKLQRNNYHSGHTPDKKGETCLDSVHHNVSMFKSVISNIIQCGPHCKLIIVSNPGQLYFNCSVKKFFLFFCWMVVVMVLVTWEKTFSEYSKLPV